MSRLAAPVDPRRGDCDCQVVAAYERITGCSPQEHLPPRLPLNHRTAPPPEVQRIRDPRYQMTVNYLYIGGYFFGTEGQLTREQVGPPGHPANADPSLNFWPHGRTKPGLLQCLSINAGAAFSPERRRAADERYRKDIAFAWPALARKVGLLPAPVSPP